MDGGLGWSGKAVVRGTVCRQAIGLLGASVTSTEDICLPALKPGLLQGPSGFVVPLNQN